MVDANYKFTKSHRLSGRLSFTRVYDQGRKTVRGPLVIFAAENQLEHSRIGLSVSRRVGTAVRRNRIKRLIRESFRVLQYELPKGYDWVIVVRPHEPLRLQEYQGLLRSGLKG